MRSSSICCEGGETAYANMCSTNVAFPETPRSRINRAQSAATAMLPHMRI